MPPQVRFDEGGPRPRRPSGAPGAGHPPAGRPARGREGKSSCQRAVPSGPVRDVRLPCGVGPEPSGTAPNWLCFAETPPSSRAPCQCALCRRRGRACGRGCDHGACHRHKSFHGSSLRRPPRPRAPVSPLAAWRSSAPVPAPHWLCFAETVPSSDTPSQCAACRGAGVPSRPRGEARTNLSKSACGSHSVWWAGQGVQGLQGPSERPFLQGDESRSAGAGTPLLHPMTPRATETLEPGGPRSTICAASAAQTVGYGVARPRRTFFRETLEGRSVDARAPFSPPGTAPLGATLKRSLRVRTGGRAPVCTLNLSVQCGTHGVPPQRADVLPIGTRQRLLSARGIGPTAPGMADPFSPLLS